MAFHVITDIYDDIIVFYTHLIMYIVRTELYLYEKACLLC